MSPNWPCPPAWDSSSSRWTELTSVATEIPYHPAGGAAASTGGMSGGPGESLPGRVRRGEGAGPGLGWARKGAKLQVRPRLAAQAGGFSCRKKNLRAAWWWGSSTGQVSAPALRQGGGRQAAAWSEPGPWSPLALVPGLEQASVFPGCWRMPALVLWFREGRRCWDTPPHTSAPAQTPSSVLVASQSQPRGR